eukprot:gb/GFBE01067839.1/.p1 GENE.gb/GFBE01067839.1/~~gb/GFBE01067839.1/.p1  ORF type:complete len:317 (+),score=35.54 gb/GFBE01067839.1/:1-951(+)
MVALTSARTYEARQMCVRQIYPQGPCQRPPWTLPQMPLQTGPWTLCTPRLSPTAGLAALPFCMRRVRCMRRLAARGGRLPPIVAWAPPLEAPEDLPELREVPGPVAAPNLRLGVLTGFLCQDEIDALHCLADHPASWEVRDRHSGLVFKHHVRRVEAVLREHTRKLYAKLLETAWAVDQRLWQSMGPDDYVHPQIEYIVYDVEQLGGEGSIAKHNDNGSLVSVVVLLSDPSDFEGGLNYFAGPPQRSVQLQPGDAVFFYGDQCEHWITPVTSGRRVILQMELQQPRPAPCEDAQQQGKSAGNAAARRGKRNRRGRN